MSSSHAGTPSLSPALEWQVDLREQVGPPREKRSHPRRSTGSRNSSTHKPLNVSSGNRFYAEVIRQRLNECKAQAPPPLARDLPKRDVKGKRMQGAASSTEESSRLQARVEELELQLERSKRQHTEIRMSAAQGTAADSPPPAKKQRSLQSLPVEEGETFGVSSGFSRVPSSNVFTRTLSAEMNAEFYQLTLTRPYEAQLVS